MKNKYVFIVLSVSLNLLLWTGFIANAQTGVSINASGTAPHTESILDVSSTTKGVLLPRMTTGQRTSFVPTTTGMTVYDISTETYWYWDDTANLWREIPNTSGIVTTLDGSYDGGTPGSGSGRIIIADAGPVDIQNTGGLLVNGRTGIGTSTPDAAYQLSVLNSNNSVKIAGSSIGMRVEVQAVGEDGIYVTHSSIGNSQAYYAIHGELSNGGTSGYLGYHTTAGGGANYAVYGTGGTYAGYFEGNVNFTGELQLNGSAGTSGQVLVSQGTGVDPIWGAAGVQSVGAGAGLVNSGTATAPILDVAADNGLNVDAFQDKVQLGGPLTEATTISHGANDLVFNLNGTGDFVVQDGGTPHFEINDNDGNAFFGGDLTFGDGSTTGTILMDVTDAGVGGDDGRLRIYTDGAVNHLIQGDGDVIFNELGNDRNFRIESDNQSNMMFLDAGLDRIGLATGSPTQMLDVNGVIRMRGGTTTSGFVPVSSGDGTMVWTDPATLGADVTTASNGLTEVSNDIRLGGTLTQNTTVVQGAFTMDFTSTAVDGFSVDGATLSVDAANNRVGIGTAAPISALEVQGGDLNASGLGRFKGWYTQGTGLAAEIGVSSGEAFLYSYNRTSSSFSPISLVGSTVGIGHNGSNTDIYINTFGNVGIGTASPSQTLDVDGSIRMRGGTTTSGWVPVSSGDGTMVWTNPALLGADVTTASNGLTEVLNDIQLGGALTQNTTVSQAAFTLDFTSTAVDGFSVDGATFSVDAANNRVGIGTAAPTAPLHVFNTLDDVVRIQGVDHARLYVDGTNGSEKAVIFSEAAVEQWKIGMDDSNGAGGNANDFVVKQTNNAIPEFVIQASSGNVGIGTTTPRATLNVGGPVGARVYLTREDAGSTVADDLLGSLLFDSTDDSGPSTNDASAGIRAYASEIHGDSNKGGYMTFFTKPSGTPTGNAAVERMRILSGGNVAIGATTASTKLYVVGDATITGKLNSNGIEETSDIRFKKNILPLSSSLEKVMQLQGVTYNWRQEEFVDRDFGSRVEIGVIAQEVEKIYPELVSTDANGYKSVQYSHMVPVLIEAIKELNSKVSDLESTVGSQKSKLDDQANVNLELKASLEKLNLRLNQFEDITFPQTSFTEQK